MTGTPTAGTPPINAVTSTGALPPDGKLAGVTVIAERVRLEDCTAKSVEPDTTPPMLALALRVAAPILETDAGAIATSATPEALVI